MTIIVAEIGNVHDGSLGNCHSFIDACADAGADAIKFQCHQGNPWSEFPERFSFHPQDDTRQAYVHRMCFTAQQWAGIRDHVKQRGKLFIVSCFSVRGVDFMDVDRRRPDMWKIPSGMVADVGFRLSVVNRGGINIISSGMSYGFKDKTYKYRLQCTTSYPCKPEHIGLNHIGAWANGLSDHSGTIYPSLAAATLGAEMVEVHVCWDKRQFGCDVSSSITVDELATLCEGVRAIETMLANPVDKAEVLKQLPDVKCYDNRPMPPPDVVNVQKPIDPREYKEWKPQFD